MFYHTRNHTRPDISQVAFSLLYQNSCHVLIREKLGKQDQRNFGVTGSVWFFFL
jgi:hypothetical protein